MNGIINTWDLIPNTIQNVCVGDKSGGTVVTLSVCNKNNVPAIISVGITTGSNDIAVNEYIEYNLELPAYGVLERTGLALAAGQYITVVSNKSNVNVVCWGVGYGDDVSVPDVINNLGSVYGDYSSSIQLTPAGTYSLTSGSLPNGLLLDSAGLISGTPTGAYAPGSTTSTFSATVNSTTRTFSITRKWYDGTSEALAAPSASYIKTLTGTTTDGKYWLKPTSGSGTAFQAYCIMARDGGGWVKVLQFNGGTNLGTVNEVDLSGIWCNSEISLYAGKIKTIDWTALNSTNSVLFRATGGSDNLFNNGAGTAKLSYASALTPYGTDLDPTANYTLYLDMTGDGTYEYNCTYTNDTRGRCNGTTNYWISDHNYNGTFGVTPPVNSTPICWTIGTDRVVTNLHWMSGLATQSAGGVSWGDVASTSWAIFVK
jgi:hypothetical protein